MKIGFIGLGDQGLPLAVNIAKGGHELYGYDVMESACEALIKEGGRKAEGPAAMARECEVVMVCVATDAQVLDVALGDNGVFRAAQPGLVFVVHSTVNPDTMAELIAGAKAAGIALVDCPVSGGAGGAKAKTMTFIAAAEPDVLERCIPVFELSGSTIIRTGTVGTATTAKLAHQVAIIGNILAMAEAVRLGTAAGLTTDVVKKVVSGGLARSFISETWGEIKMRPHAIPNYTKDLTNSIKLAEKCGISLPGTELMRKEIENIVP